METQNFKLLESVMNLAKERDFYKAENARLKAELTEFYKVREFMNSINSNSYVSDNAEDNTIPFEDSIDTLEVNLQNDIDIDTIEFEAPIPTSKDIEIPDFTEFIQDETEEEENEINLDENGFNEDLFNEVLAEVMGDVTTVEEKQIEEDINESLVEAGITPVKEEETSSSEVKEIVQSKSTIEILDRRRKEFDNPEAIEGYIQNVLDSYIPRKTEFGEENPLLKDIKKVYSFVSKVLKRDSLKYIKEVLDIEDGFKVPTRYKLSIMNALRDIKYIIEYQDEPLSQKQGTFDIEDKELIIGSTPSEAQEIEDTEPKTEQKAPKVQTDLKGKIISFYDRESIKDTKEKDLKLFEDMTEEQLKDRFVTDVNFQINALKNGWNIKHFKSAEEDFSDTIPALMGDELKKKMDLDFDLLKLLN